MKEEFKKKRKDSVLKYYDKKGRTGTLGKNGYIAITIYGKRNYMHRVVWEQYYGDIPNGFIIHHRDGNKLNNSIENLELISNAEHSRLHAKQNMFGKNRIGNSPPNKVDKDTILKIIDLREKGYKLKEIQKIVNKSYPTVQKYAKGERKWKLY